MGHVRVVGLAPVGGEWLAVGLRRVAFFARLPRMPPADEQLESLASELDLAAISAPVQTARRFNGQATVSMLARTHTHGK